jgi:hypothetical protein
MEIVTLKDRIGSSSHNANGEDESGYFWRCGTQFELLDQKRMVKAYGKGKTYLKQIGGEEVIISIPDDIGLGNIFE